MVEEGGDENGRIDVMRVLLSELSENYVNYFAIRMSKYSVVKTTAVNVCDERYVVQKLIVSVLCTYSPQSL